MKRLIIATLIALPSASALACATCGCTLSTDAATGYTANAGWYASLDYSFLHQNQLRTGTHSVPTAQVAAINDAGGDQEVERGTINRITTLGLTYAPNAVWSFRLTLPYVDRGHTTYASATNPVTPDQISGATVHGIGDVKLLLNYQGLLPTHNLGLQAGIKLPTGHYGGASADGSGIVGRHPAAFSSGPLSNNASPDNLLDTSLQAGTGSTDLIVGAYYYQAVSQNFDAFVNGQFQAAAQQKLNQPGEDFRPGNQATVSVGLRYQARPDITPQLQLNLSRRNRDQGALADTGNTAGTAVYLSPGLTMSVLKNMQLYGFVQLPVYSKLAGYQLFPRWTASVGASYAF
ncbi:transporter [Rugamonas apoptosis]|uniref:Transporter n=1 Tax=Rugamonas apoptosis TaxID=2758570 RepID=A0A7W2F9H6_9BURK|nr:transporter [Rugamonas apoptosis]MBA5687593.1 transporter [Rugamonas apoptosis]